MLLNSISILFFSSSLRVNTWKYVPFCTDRSRNRLGELTTQNKSIRAVFGTNYIDVLLNFSADCSVVMPKLKIIEK